MSEKNIDEEAVKLGKKELQEGLTYDGVAFLFLKQSYEVVQDTVRVLKDSEEEFGAVERPKLPIVEEELNYFFLFALHYWWQKSPSYTQEQKQTLERVLFHGLSMEFGDDAQGHAAWNALQERFIAYGQIVNEQQDDSAKLHRFAKKLSAYCGTPYFHFVILAPSLFTTALKTISALATDKRRLR